MAIKDPEASRRHWIPGCGVLATAAKEVKIVVDPRDRRND